MEYFVAIAPSLGVGILFYVVIRAFTTADRRERAADAEFRKQIKEQLRKDAEGNS